MISENLYTLLSELNAGDPVQDDEELDDSDWDEHSADSSDDEDEDTDDTPGRQREPSDPPHKIRTRNFRNYLAQQGDIASRVKEVLGYMLEKKLYLPLLLWALSWNVPELIADPLAKFECTALMISDELGDLLGKWFKPPRGHGRGIKTKGAASAINTFAVSCIKNTIHREMARVGKVMRTNEKSR
ncbi:hypothetical protein SCP_0806300 [Sparassis crispa]|uniref:Uncharacterized protein n=1 Tax=Sparassis crispa TaxID=139825 RepID=A0A401GV83_9APHY|nr:hypothetical protein SCP_0806300 [Sparassis crispa]GBE86106.1 hypothetical protein SCP_0806300 [Sparassis crispa]